MRYLLDVNVWLALMDDAHLFSPRANQWYEAEQPAVASCPLTENGAVRIFSTASYSTAHKVTPATAAKHLIDVCRRMDHVFWPDDVSLRNPSQIDVTRLHGPRQITDAYLLALAVAHDGCLLTFDGAVALSAVPGAKKKHLRVL